MAPAPGGLRRNVAKWTSIICTAANFSRALRAVSLASSRDTLPLAHRAFLGDAIDTFGVDVKSAVLG